MFYHCGMAFRDELDRSQDCSRGHNFESDPNCGTIEIEQCILSPGLSHAMISLRMGIQRQYERLDRLGNAYMYQYPRTLPPAQGSTRDRYPKNRFSVRGDGVGH